MSYITVAVLALVAGYMLYVARLLAVAFVQRMQKTAPPSLSTNLSLTHVLTGDKGDCDYDLLWQTQMPALKVLRSGGSGGVPDSANGKTLSTVFSGISGTLRWFEFPGLARCVAKRRRGRLLPVWSHDRDHRKRLTCFA